MPKPNPRPQKPETVPVQIRLPLVDLPELDALAAEERESRAGLISRLTLDYLRKRRQQKKR